MMQTLDCVAAVRAPKAGPEGRGPSLEEKWKAQGVKFPLTAKHEVKLAGKKFVEGPFFASG